VLRELEIQCNSLPRALTARKSLENWGAIVLAPDMDFAVSLSNRIAPEHLELLVQEPWALLPRIRHAGAVFMGPYSPEAVGDYFAGPNHVLPTLGTARFASALSVQSFCKRTSIIAASPDFARTHANSIARLARLEGLEAHARSAEARQGR
jgi:histidinol dehydrogenase